MGRVNSWLSDRVQTIEGQDGLQAAADYPIPGSKVLPFIVEADSTEAIQVVRQGLLGLGLTPDDLTVGPFLLVAAPASQLNAIAALPGVRVVSYNAPVWIRQLPPIFDIVDPILGQIKLSPATMPTSLPSALGLAPLKLPLLIPALLSQALTPLGIKLPQIMAPDQVIVPTGEARLFIGAPEENKIDTLVAVLDTGAFIPHPLLLPSQKVTLLSTTGEPPLDGLGHGMWCVTAAFGGAFTTRFGLCRGVVEAADIVSIKCLSNIGFGTNWFVLQAMEQAVRKGAKVISMSLGGELQGSVNDDPQSRFIELNKTRAIFVVAASNEGPKAWAIGSPGSSPDCVTVGAWSTHYDSLAIFSSRGPQGAWYGEDPTRMTPDFSLYGNNLLKPDLVAPGGGPGSILIALPGAIPIPVDQPAGTIKDQLYSGVVGWVDGVGDLTPGDGFDSMRGTSMATPIASGLIAYAVDRGMLSSAQQVKDIMALTTRNHPDLKWGVRIDGAPVKDPRVGYGLITLGRLQGGIPA